MQMITRNYAKIVVFAGITGALVASVCAFLTQDHYVSTAVVRFTFEGLSESDRRGTVDRLTQVEREVLSRRSLGELITKPALDLYQEDRTRMPLEDVVQNMRKDLRINQREGSDWRARYFDISCSYPDRFKAQSVVRELVARFVEQINTMQRNQAPPAAATLELLAPARLPERLFMPNRPLIITTGLLAGAMLGSLAILVARFTASA